VAGLFEPGAEARDLSGAADGVGAFDDDEFALEFGDVDVGEGIAVELEGQAGFHLAVTSADGFGFDFKAEFGDGDGAHLGLLILDGA
jgi:hypothetical protein